MNKTIRINQLQKILQEDYYTVPEIIKHFDIKYKSKISRETIYRYFHALSQMGYQVSKQKNKYCIVATETKPDGIKTLYSSEFTPVRGNVTTKILRGLKYSLPAKISYLSPRFDQLLDFQLKLIDLVRIKNKVYLIAKDHGDDVIKEFRVDRIKNFELGHSMDRKQVVFLSVCFIVKGDFVKHFNCPMEIVDKEILANGDEKYTVQTHSYFRAKKLLMEYLDQIVVLGPNDFLIEFLETVKAIMANYPKLKQG